MNGFLASGGGALLGGIIGALAGAWGSRLTSKTARRDQMWKRVEWAIALLLKDEDRPQELGYIALAQIVAGNLADPRDVKIIVALANAALEDIWGEEPGDDDDYVVEDDEVDDEVDDV